MPQEKFWQSVNVLSALYQIKGGVTEIRNYNGKDNAGSGEPYETAG